MTRIFISYRRDDSRTFTGRIYDRLIGVFGSENVFRDLDGIALGSDFRRVIEREVASCDLFLAIIGPRWVDDQNRKRLNDPADFVRIEVETALRLPEVKVIPVLVDNARSPSAANLPTTLADLPYRNAAVVRDDPDFHTDVDKLIASIKKLIPASEPVTEISPTKPQTGLDPKLIIALVALVLVIVVIAAIANNSRQAASPTLTSTFTASSLPPTNTLTPTQFVPPVGTATQSIQLDVTSTEIMLQRTIDAKQTAISQSFSESTHIAETANAVPIATVISSAQPSTKTPTISTTTGQLFAPKTYPCEGVIVISSGKGFKLNQIYTLPQRNAPNKTPATQGEDVVIVAKQHSDGEDWYQINYANNKNSGWIPMQYVTASLNCPS